MKKTDYLIFLNFRKEQALSDISWLENEIIWINKQILKTQKQIDKNDQKKHQSKRINQQK